MKTLFCKISFSSLIFTKKVLHSFHKYLLNNYCEPDTLQGLKRELSVTLKGMGGRQQVDKKYGKWDAGDMHRLLWEHRTEVPNFLWGEGWECG